MRERDILPVGRDRIEEGIPVRYVRDPLRFRGETFEPDFQRKMWVNRATGLQVGAVKVPLSGGRERWFKVDGSQIEEAADEGLPHSRYADALTRAMTFATLQDTDELLVYREGVYCTEGESAARAWLEGRVRSLEKSSPKSHLVNETLAAVRRRTYAKRESFNPPGSLCLRNGILDLRTLEIGPLTPDVRFMAQLPIAYDAIAPCPRWLRFMEEILPETSHREIVQMWFGYCLEAGNPYQIAFMGIGEGNNGKSTCLGVLRELLGRDSISGETLQRLSENRFAAANLWGKLANICADIPSTAIRYSGMFKMLTGGDLVPAEKKNQHSFAFVNGAKLTFSANELPEVNDRTRAFWRRWILIPFTQDFSGREDHTLLTSLCGELSGILNWSLAGLRRLRERGGFPEDTSADDLKGEWKRHADSVFWFWSECVEVDPNGWEPKERVYAAYKAFCAESNARSEKYETFCKRVRDLPEARSVRQERASEGSRPWGWRGMRLTACGERADNPDNPDRKPRLSDLSDLSGYFPPAEKHSDESRGSQ